MVLVLWDGFFHVGAAACWLFRFQRPGGSLAIFHFDDLFPIKASEWCWRAKVSKATWWSFRLRWLEFGYVDHYTWREIGFFNSMMVFVWRGILMYSAL